MMDWLLIVFTIASNPAPMAIMTTYPQCVAAMSAINRLAPPPYQRAVCFGPAGETVTAVPQLRGKQ